MKCKRKLNSLRINLCKHAGETENWKAEDVEKLLGV